MKNGETQKVSRLLVYARENGIIPWSWIVDETREPERVSAWNDYRPMVKQYLGTRTCGITDLRRAYRARPTMSISASDLERARDIRRDLAGPCPVCGSTDRFSINALKQVFNCRGCGAKSGGAVDFIMFLDGVDFKQAVEILVGNVPAPQRSSPPQAERPDNRDDDAKRRDLAMNVWRSARDPCGTLVAAYLKSRKLELPDVAAGEAIRFDPRVRRHLGRLPPAHPDHFWPVDRLRRVELFPDVLFGGGALV